MLRYRTAPMAIWLTAGALAAWIPAPGHPGPAPEPLGSTISPPASPSSLRSARGPELGLPAPVTGAALGAIALALARRRG